MAGELVVLTGNGAFGSDVRGVEGTNGGVCLVEGVAGLLGRTEHCRGEFTSGSAAGQYCVARRRHAAVAADLAGVYGLLVGFPCCSSARVGEGASSSSVVFVALFEFSGVVDSLAVDTSSFAVSGVSDVIGTASSCTSSEWSVLKSTVVENDTAENYEDLMGLRNGIGRGNRLGCLYLALRLDAEGGARPDSFVYRRVGAGTGVLVRRRLECVGGHARLPCHVP